MDRLVWLAGRRAAVIAAYDAEAPAYDEHEYPSDVQREWVARALRLIPPGGTVLDAPFSGTEDPIKAGRIGPAVKPPYCPDLPDHEIPYVRPKNPMPIVRESGPPNAHSGCYVCG